MARQDPIDSEGKRRWSAWGICTTNGQLAEVTLDAAKAAVWRQGGHKVIEFVHEEDLGRAPDDQGKLL